MKMVNGSSSVDISVVNIFLKNHFCLIIFISYLIMLIDIESHFSVLT